MLAQVASDDSADAIRSLADQAQAIAQQVHEISHGLHPVELKQLGIVKAACGVCNEVERVHGVEIEFEARHVPRGLADDKQLCIYRILQESLTNAVRHGKAPRATVRIAGMGTTVRMEVADEGCGFDVESLGSSGIGLTSMRERAHHLGGRFELASRPGRGTRVEIVLPVE